MHKNRFLSLTAVFISTGLITGFLPADDRLIALEVPEALRTELKSFEPSAAIYLPEMERYLITSDDTTESDSPWLFTMDAEGRVDENPLVISGVRKLTDMESLSRGDNGAIYILSSQGLNKNGKNKKERNLFIKAELSDSGLEATASIELRPLLIAALEESEEPTLQNMRGEYEELLDVESHFVRNGELYVGLKNPQPEPGHGVIVNLGPVDDVLNGTINLQFWQTLDLTGANGEANLISDLLLVGENIFITTTSEDGQGSLWSLKESNLSRLETFSGLHPEGLVHNGQGLSILFDQGEDGDGLLLHLPQ